MFATYLTVGLCVWGIAALFAMAFIHGAHRPTTRKEQQQMHLRGEGA